MTVVYLSTACQSPIATSLNANALFIATLSIKCEATWVMWHQHCTRDGGQHSGQRKTHYVHVCVVNLRLGTWQ